LLLVAAFIGSGSLTAQARQYHDQDESIAQSADNGTASDIVVEDLPLGNHLFQRISYAPPLGVKRGTIVMFPGGAGTIGIERNGAVKHGDNFLVRTDNIWRQKGYGIVLVDAIDHQSLRGQRSSEDYAEITRRIVQFAIQQAGKPVWIMGTSQGAIAAMNTAAHLGTNDIAGLVLSESVSVQGHSHETVFDAHPQNVTVPSLVVANRSDSCDVAPPEKAQTIADAMSHSHSTVLIVQGGEQGGSKDCGSLSPHGYYGIEEAVIDRIVDWMSKTSG